MLVNNVKSEPLSPEELCQSDQFHVGVYSEALSFWSTVMTTFPFLCPVSTYR